MIDLFDFILLSFATWRLSSLLVREEGPHSIFPRLKHWLGQKYLMRLAQDDPETGQKVNVVREVPFKRRLEATQTINGNEILIALSCIWCTSIWVSLLFVTLYSVFYNNLYPFEWFIAWLAVSGLAIAINKQT